MAAHLNRESRFGVLTPRLPSDIAGDIAAQVLGVDTSIGIANTRPSVAGQILFGQIPKDSPMNLFPACYSYEIYGSQWLDLWNTYPDSPYFFPFGGNKDENFQSLLVDELLDDELSIEYLAANIERGVDRARDHLGIEPSVFNLGNWLWRGVQDPVEVKRKLNEGEDVFRHGAAIVEDMPKAIEVLGFSMTPLYNAYNPEEAEFIGR